MKQALEVAGGKHLVLESDVLVLLVTFDSGPTENVAHHQVQTQVAAERIGGLFWLSMIVHQMLLSPITMGDMIGAWSFRRQAMSLKALY